MEGEEVGVVGGGGGGRRKEEGKTAGEVLLPQTL